MDIKVPQVGESIVEAEIGSWLKKDGDYVTKDELVLELETEKVNVELNAEESGILSILAEDGDTVKVGEVIGRIDTSASPPEADDSQKDGDTNEDAETDESEESSKKESDESEESSKKEADEPKESSKEETDEGTTSDTPEKTEKASGAETSSSSDKPMNPAVQKIAAQRGVDPHRLEGSGRDGRVLVDDIPADAKDKSATKEKSEESTSEKTTAPASTEGKTERVPMSRIRRKIAEHLLKATQETAMLTTFNEADLSRIIALRSQYKEAFQKKYDVSLGFMSFFIRACAEALKDYPEVNASIDGDDIIYHHYYDIGIAVGSKRGLVVPVIRRADTLPFDQIESTIRDFAQRAQTGKLSLDELEGGTFSITNGGIYGSVLSTPLLNPPQSAILGMHAIQDRAVVREGEIVIRPMMNLALSYDHRLIDGQQAVRFLMQVKTYIETPETLLLQV